MELIVTIPPKKEVISGISAFKDKHNLFAIFPSNSFFRIYIIFYLKQIIIIFYDLLNNVFSDYIKILESC